MPCNKCLIYIIDTLLQPPLPSSPQHIQFRPKRLRRCIEPLSYLLLRFLENSRPDLFAWLNMMEMLNYPVLKKEASREYRLYQILCLEKSDIHEILSTVIEERILDKCAIFYEYEEWLAEKLMRILANRTELHPDHEAAFTTSQS